MPEVVEVYEDVTTVEVTSQSPLVIEVTEPAPLTIEVAAAGAQGPVGPTPNIGIGEVVTGAEGTSAAATVTGTPSDPRINLTIPRGNVGATGATGPTGPANELLVGTVEQLAPVDSPAINITGNSPSQTINFGIPAGSRILNGTTVPDSGTGLQGDWFVNDLTSDLYEKTGPSTWTLRTNLKGDAGDAGATGPTGPANQLSVGTVTASPPGSAPDVTIGGASPSQTISFTLPRGDTGPIGPAPNLAMGNTTTVEPGGTATASITGTNPNYTINLGIPRGDKGEVGSQWLTGIEPPDTGSGVVGDFYLVNSGAGLGDVYKKTGASVWTLQGNIRGPAGTGNVNSVNSILPDGSGDVSLTWNDFTGTIPASALPSIATTETYPVTTEAEMLALAAQRGDLAIRTDVDETYILAGDDPSILTNWTVLLTDGGNVRLTGDQTVGGTKTFSAGPIVPDNSWTIAKTSGLQGALDSKEGTIAAGTTAQYYRGDKTFQTLDATAVGLGNVVDLAQVDLVNDQIIGGIKTFSSGPIVPDASFTIAKTNGLQGALDGKSNTGHVHDTADVTTGTFAIARIPTGTTGTTVALGDHLHTGVYEPLIAAGTTAQYRRGDNTWQTLNVAAVSGAAPLASPTFTGTVSGITATMVGLGNVANLAQVDLVNDQTINGAKTFSEALVGSSTITAGGTGFAGPGVNITTLNATNLTTGLIPDARLPDRLGITAETITDWDLAAPNGFYYGASTALNSPTAHAYSGMTVRLSSTNMFQQVTRSTGGPSGANTLTYRRHMQSGVWGAWFVLSIAQEEQDARYAQIGNTVLLTDNQTIGGIKTFSSAPEVPDASFTIAKTNGLQGALDLKAPLASPAFTGTPTGINKAHVGLGNVDNLAQVDLVNPQTIGGAKTFIDTITLGDDDQDLFFKRAVEVETHQRNVTNTYTYGKLTQVVEKDGTTTVSTTTLNYTGEDLTSTVEVVGGKTITTTFTYSGADITSVTRSVT